MDWFIRGKSLCYLAKFDFIQSVCNTVFILVLWYGLMLQLSQEMEFVVVKLFCLPAFPRSRFIFHSRVSNQCDRIISKVVGKWKFQQLVFHNTRGTSCERQQSGASRGFQDLTNAPSGKFVILSRCYALSCRIVILILRKLWAILLIALLIRQVKQENTPCWLT